MGVVGRSIFWEEWSERANAKNSQPMLHTLKVKQEENCGNTQKLTLKTFSGIFCQPFLAGNLCMCWLEPVLDGVVCLLFCL